MHTMQGSGSTELSLEKLAVQLLSIEEVSQLLHTVRHGHQGRAQAAATVACCPAHTTCHSWSSD